MEKKKKVEMRRLTHKNKDFLIFNNIEEISDFLIKSWIDISKKAINKKNRFVVVLPGGKTPIPIYKKLASSKNTFPWEKIHIFLSDERFVSFDNAESNYRMIKDNLLNNVSIPMGNIHPIYIKESAQISAKKYEEDIKRFFNLKEGQLPKFDLVILGVGEDGHTASLFPKDKALFEKEHLALTVHLDRLRHERISLIFPVINNANNIIFLVTGASKAKIIKEILDEKNNQLPVSLVRPTHGDVLFLLDAKAASFL